MKKAWADEEEDDRLMDDRATAQAKIDGVAVRLALAVNVLRTAHASVNFDTPEDNALRDRVLQTATEAIGPFEPFIEGACEASYRSLEWAIAEREKDST